jgi:hypothetical protein
MIGEITMIETNKQFNKTLVSIGTSGNAINKNVQLCCIFALDQYINHSANTDPMDRLMRKCEAAKGIAANKLKDYLEAHANVQWRKETKDGKEVTRFIRRKGEDAKVVTPTVDWMDFAKVRKTTTNKIDPDVVVSNAIKRINKGLEDKNLKTSAKRAQLVLKALAFAMENIDNIKMLQELIDESVVTELKEAA